MTVSDLARAISSLRPGAPWVLRGDTLADLEWLDAGSPLTEAEISAEVARLAALDSAWATDTDRLDIIGKLKGASPTQIKNYVQNRHRLGERQDVAEQGPAAPEQDGVTMTDELPKANNSVFEAYSLAVSEADRGQV